jgi:hypothetical protein
MTLDLRLRVRWSIDASPIAAVELDNSVRIECAQLESTKRNVRREPAGDRASQPTRSMGFADRVEHSRRYAEAIVHDAKHSLNSQW